MTVIPELDIEKLRRLLRRRCPDQLADEVRLELTVAGKRLLVHERRPVRRGATGEWTSMPIAQLRYDGNGHWTLYFGNRYGQWSIYPDLDSAQPIDVIIAEIDEDPTSVFWG